MRKKLIYFIAFFFVGIVMYSQTDGFNYKAIIYDNENPIQNQNVDLQFTILENGTTNVYQETHATTTDTNGIAIVNIGEGTEVSGDFTSINWENSQSLKVEVNTGSGYVNMGTTAFKYVPLAKHAETATQTDYAVYADNADIANSAGTADFATVAGNVPTNTSELVNDSGYLTTEIDGSITNELQTISKSGNTVTLSNGGGSFIDTDTDTQLTETQVDNFVANNGYLTSEVDGSTTNELQSLSVNGTQLTISNGNTVTLPTGSGGDQWGSQTVQSNTSLTGDGTSVNPLAVDTNSSDFNNWDKNASDDFSGNFNDLSNVPTGLADGDDDTQLTETQVDNYVANNGYLTTEIDGSTTNELQTISKSGNTVTLSNGGGSFTDADTQLTETQVDNFVSNNGYLTSEVDGSTTNELQTISKLGNTVTLSNGGGSFTDADTQLTETQVDNFVSNNGYLTTEIDGSTTNELQTISKSGNTVTLSNGGGSFTDADTQLTETQVDNFVANNGYLTSETDGDATNELQTLSLSGNVLSISDGNNVTLPSSSGSDVDFLEVGTGQAPNNILDDIYHTGNISVGHSTTPNAKLDIKNTGTSTAANSNTGIKITNNNSSNTDKIGVNTLLDAAGTAKVYGTKNYLLDNGDGDMYGTHTTIGGLNGDGDHYGNYLYLTGDGTGIHTGSKVLVSAGGTAQQIGNDIEIYTVTNANTAVQTGVKTHIYGEGTGDKYGVTNLIDGNADGNLYGTENTISNTNDSYAHYGTINRMQGSGNGNHYGTSNITTGTGEGQQYGVRNFNSNSGNNTHYGVYSKLNGAGSGVHIGTNNLLQGDGTGEQVAVLNEVSNTSDAIHYGVKNMMTGEGTGHHYGSYSELNGAGIGHQTGAYYEINNTGSGVHTGVKAILNGTGTYSQTGLHTEINNTGDGYQYGVLSIVDNSGNGQHTAVSGTLRGTGTGTQYGIKSTVSNSGSGDHYGNYTSMSNGTGKQYGNRMLINGNSSNGAENYGNYITLYGSSAGDKYGEKTFITSSNNSSHYGNYVELTGTGSGDHYGFYSKVERTSNPSTGSLYGVYANLVGSPNIGEKSVAIYGNVNDINSDENKYAGYFVGNVYASKKLLSNQSGNADMKAFIYGNVNASSSGGSIVVDSSSDGFTVTRSSAGVYKITFDISAGIISSGDDYIVIVTLNNNANAWVTGKSFTRFYVNIKSGLNWRDYDFQFVVYKK